MLLDCENYNSTLDSISMGLGVDSSILAGLIAKIDPDAIDYDEYEPGNFGGILLKKIGAELNLKKLFTGSYWFHASRVPASTTYEEGLLHAKFAKEKIWNIIMEIGPPELSSDLLNGIRKSMESFENGTYHYKVNRQPGPHGNLIFDVILARRSGHYDYLAGPELLDDICHRILNTKYGEDAKILWRKYMAATKPVVVKYQGCYVDDPMICATLCYIHSTLRGEALDDNSVSCYKGGDGTMPREMIEKVIWIDNDLSEPRY